MSTVHAEALVHSLICMNPVYYKQVNSAIFDDLVELGKRSHLDVGGLRKSEGDPEAGNDDVKVFHEYHDM
ncbi:hypothetical protein K443DRAFT_675431 [Laccaria amethystina LaAM-08-1]|uniref:Uncharacterized protein n=1 Tax=Laccaria amethystina LaAM-08-1 TaxID=1095629 RepID=A0A0C9Y4S1_9AGAR|nr:hypothetical protein K443DRAFT_675431 [Laccaria amethystina LaAM-08-1]